jgi:hypothetical protein
MLQKSPWRSCRIKIRNNRIGANGFLNQCCALMPDLESILHARTDKIVLQHNPIADIAPSLTMTEAVEARLHSGKESNWVPTKAGGRFEVLFRFYGPEKPLFDSSSPVCSIHLLDVAELPGLVCLGLKKA